MRSILQIAAVAALVLNAAAVPTPRTVKNTAIIPSGDDVWWDSQKTKLFHSKDGKPISPTDAEVDAAIAAHYAAPSRRKIVPRQNDEIEDWFLKRTPAEMQHDREVGSFNFYNVTERQQMAATHDKHNKPISLTDEQLRAIIAADQSPTREEYNEADDQPKAYQNKREKDHLIHIYKVIDAGFSLDDIHTLFHSKDGKPIRLTDKEIDAAISAKHNESKGKAILPKHEYHVHLARTRPQDYPEFYGNTTAHAADPTLHTAKDIPMQ